MEPIASGTTAAATAAHTRYLSSPAAATLHGKMPGFVFRLPPQNKAHATFIHPHHFPSSSLPFVTTSLHHHFPSSHHHFPSSPLPIVTTSLPHHFPSSPPYVIASYYFVIYVLLCYVLLCDLPPFIKVNCIASYSFVMYCYVMYCFVIYHPSSRSIT